MVERLEIRASEFLDIRKLSEDRGKYAFTDGDAYREEIYMCDCDQWGGGNPPCDCNR